MDQLRNIRDETAALAALARPERLAMLRRLMGEPATITQLCQDLGHYPSWIRHHVLVLERAGLVSLIEERHHKGYVERFYGATARAYAINLIVLPTSANRDLLVVVGSDDRALDLLTQRLRDDQHGPDVVSLATGSLAGLIALRQGVGDVAGSHLPENGRGQFNRSYVRAIFPDRSLLLITLAYRVQGLVVQAGNPLGLRGVGDLVRLRAPIVNRNRGSGTRVWFDRLLSEAGAKSGDLPGYENEVATHAEVAAAVASGSAQAGLATAAAGTARGLAFVPLFKERYELVVPTEKVNRAPVTRLLATLDSNALRGEIERLPGYSARYTGRVRQIAA